MAFDYVESAQDALALLMDFEAKQLTITVTAPEPEGDDYDPSTGTGAELPPVVLGVLGVVLDYSMLRKNNGTQEDSRVRAGDRYVITAALDVNGATIMPEQMPVGAQVLAADGLTYVIRDVNPLNPTGIPVLYELNVRR